MSEGRRVRSTVPGKSGPRPRPKGSIRCPCRLGTVSEVPRCRPAVLDDSRPCPSSQGVHQLSRTPHDPVRGPVGSPAGLDDSLLCLNSHGTTSCPGQLAPISEGPRVRSAVPGDLGPGPSSRSIDQLSRRSGPCPRAHRVDHLSWATHARDRQPAASTICHGRHGLGSMSQSR